MTKGFTVDFIEQKKELLFVAGTSLSPLALGDSFTALYQYGKSQNSKQKKGEVTLKIESILVAGEAFEEAKANESLLLALSGDGQALLDAAKALQWQSKSGRLFRSTEAALSLESDET
jgi:hypothetical protein